jgi:serine protease Do
MSTPELIHGALAALAERLARVTVRVREHGSGEGSGVILHPRGLVVTNAHVARRHPIVVLPDGRETRARVVAWDPERDLAALDIDTGGLGAADVGPSRRVRPGELVLGVGHPFGLGRAASLGVVHSVIRGDGDDPPRWIRADLRLAPGNSGGPLADAHGRVIGINSMIADGLAVAAPIHVVERFLRSWLGRRREAAGVA